MGCEIARRRFLLTSATGAATVSQPQCRGAAPMGGLNLIFFFQKLSKKKKLSELTEGSNPVCDAKCWIWTLASLMSFSSEKDSA